MSGQLSLPGLDATSPPFRLDVIPTRRGKPRSYTLFLAVVPELEDARRLAHAATDLHGPKDKNVALLLPERLHITLHEIAHFIDQVPQSVVDATLAAASSVVCAPLPITFDRVLSFAGSHAFVWRCTPASDAAIARLRQSLVLPLRRAGLHPEPSRTPHMTMLYDPRHVPEHAIEPISWTATRFALILSHVGAEHHQWIAEWALADRP